MRISRRAFIASCAATTVATASGGASAQAREVRIGYPLGEQSPCSVGAQVWAESIGKSTSNAFVFRHLTGMGSGSEAEWLEGLWAGRIDAALLPSHALRHLVPGLGVVDVPYLFRDTAHARAVLDSPFGQELLGHVRVQGLMALAWGELGFRQLGNSRRPLPAPDAVAGLKFGVADNPWQVQALRALGASAVTMGWADLLPALEHHGIDGQDQPLSVFISAGLWRVQPHLSLTSHAYAPLVLVVAPGFWNSLSDLQKAAFTRGARLGAVATRRFVDETEKNGLELVRSNGVQVLADLEAAAFRSALAPLARQSANRYGSQTLEQIARVR